MRCAALLPLFLAVTLNAIAKGCKLPRVKGFVRPPGAADYFLSVFDTALFDPAVFPNVTTAIDQVREICGMKNGTVPQPKTDEELWNMRRSVRHDFFLGYKAAGGSLTLLDGTAANPPLVPILPATFTDDDCAVAYWKKNFTKTANTLNVKPFPCDAILPDGIVCQHQCSDTSNTLGFDLDLPAIVLQPGGQCTDDSKITCSVGVSSNHAKFVEFRLDGRVVEAVSDGGQGLEAMFPTKLGNYQYTCDVSIVIAGHQITKKVSKTETYKCESSKLIEVEQKQPSDSDKAARISELNDLKQDVDTLASDSQDRYTINLVIAGASLGIGGLCLILIAVMLVITIIAMKKRKAKTGADAPKSTTVRKKSQTSPKAPKKKKPKAKTKQSHTMVKTGLQTAHSYESIGKTKGGRRASTTSAPSATTVSSKTLPKKAKGRKRS